MGLKRKIIIIEIIIIVMLLYMIMIPEVEAEKEPIYFIMNVTFYSLHENCISKKWNDGYTATMTPIRRGVAAINVDMINGEWVVVSPLKLGQRIYIEDLGEFVIEDTGRFGERDAIQDIYTVDIFEPDHEKAILNGKQLRKIFVIND